MRTLFAESSTRRASIGLGIAWFCQATGYWGITLFLPTYLAQRGINVYVSFWLLSGTQTVRELLHLLACVTRLVLTRSMVGVAHRRVCWCAPC